MLFLVTVDDPMSDAHHSGVIKSFNSMSFLLLKKVNDSFLLLLHTFYGVKIVTDPWTNFFRDTWKIAVQHKRWHVSFLLLVSGPFLLVCSNKV